MLPRCAIAERADARLRSPLSASDRTCRRATRRTSRRSSTTARTWSAILIDAAGSADRRSGASAGGALAHHQRAAGVRLIKGNARPTRSRRAPRICASATSRSRQRVPRGVSARSIDGPVSAAAARSAASALTSRACARTVIGLDCRRARSPRSTRSSARACRSSDLGRHIRRSRRCADFIAGELTSERAVIRGDSGTQHRRRTGAPLQCATRCVMTTA